MIDLAGLNPEQKQAVTKIRGPLMILAGAGTGKTRVITYRMAHMIAQGIPAESIVALTFTNKAAREMAERAKHLVGSKVKKVWVGTFHGFCLQILRTYSKEAGLGSRFGLIGTGDQLDLVRRALEDKGWSGLFQPEPLHFHISMAKNYLLSPDDFVSGNYREYAHLFQKCDVSVLAEVYRLYESQLRLNHVIDFDDCIYKTVNLLKHSEEVRAKVRASYRYFLVDEYQDTNQSQLAVLQLVASDHHDVCVVGDDDQSIYSWRGAMYEVVELFEKLFPNPLVVKLEQNYRCSNVILEAANTVIRNNLVRKDKTLWSESKEASPIVLTGIEDERHEAQGIADKCMSLLGAGYKPSDIGILYRANAQARPLELALRESRLPYRTFGGQSFFEKKEIKDFLGYLRLVLNSNDRLALWRIINVPNRGLGLKTLEKIEHLSQLHKCGPFQAMQRYAHELDSRATQKVRDFVDLVSALQEMATVSPQDLQDLGTTIIQKAGLVDDIKSHVKNATQRERKVENLRGLPQWLQQMGQSLLEEKGRIKKEQLLDVLCLDQDRGEDKDKHSNHISLMTMHAAKGLEFPVVFVCGLEEEILPHKNSATHDGICEERRLFYVALTRAKQKLFLSYCLERNGMFNNKQERKPSRFLNELPKHCYENQEATSFTITNNKEERKTSTLSKLQSLRSSLQIGPK